MKAPPENSAAAPRRAMSTRAFTAGALVITLLIACVVSIWASGHPDGLEYVAESNGFLESGRPGAASEGPLADYSVLGITDPALSLAVAGAIGCVVVFGLAWLVGRAARRGPADD